MSIASRLTKRITVINEAVAINYGTIDRYHQYAELISKKFNLGPNKEFKVDGSRHYALRFGPCENESIKGKFIYLLLDFVETDRKKYGKITHYLLADKAYSKNFTKAGDKFTVSDKEFTPIPADVVKIEDVIALVTGVKTDRKPLPAEVVLEKPENTIAKAKFVSNPLEKIFKRFLDKSFSSDTEESPILLKKIPEISAKATAEFGKFISNKQIFQITDKSLFLATDKDLSAVCNTYTTGTPNFTYINIQKNKTNSIILLQNKSRDKSILVSATTRWRGDTPLYDHTIYCVK